MSTALPPAITIRLEKAAVDNGFDQELPRQGQWLGFASTQAPLRIWLTALDEEGFLAALSQQNVVRALNDYGVAFTDQLPSGACGGRGVAGIPELHHLVRRAFQLSKTLPDELLYVFEKKTATLPRATEAERLVVQRVGQEIFRTGLLEYWEGRCAVTGLAIVELLRASHIKPWASCATDGERLDVFNGLLLAPHLDAAFDRGFMTITDDGGILLAGTLGEEARRTLGLDVPMRVRAITESHRAYLRWHRESVFKGPAKRGAS